MMNTVGKGDNLGAGGELPIKHGNTKDVFIPAGGRNLRGEERVGICRWKDRSGGRPMS